MLILMSSGVNIMKDFILGCNYWASNAGTEMWKDFDIKSIEDDLRILSSNGISMLRVFPNWRDFQPIIPMIFAGGGIIEYRLEGDIISKNPYYIDEAMMSRFSKFCDVCDKYNIKITVGLLTGWMSGRLFIPSALFGKNLITDPTALLFEQKFIKGFISAFKERKTIYAWDIGNECSCLSNAGNRFAAENWTCTMANTIKSVDSTRLVISGVHDLSPDSSNTWSIAGQAEHNDVIVCHPYPYWSTIANKDEISTYRTSMHATYMEKLYTDIGKKPCLTEEIGTMGPMICSDERAADFLRCNLFSNWANGSMGIMWWCANEQTNLNTPPYTWNMCEVELGLIDAKRNPKPVLKEYKKFAEFLKGFNTKLPYSKYDAVCILTQKQNQTAIGFTTFCLAKQADINLKFVFSADELPESDIYMMPSITGQNILPKERYEELKRKVQDGASLYISYDGGVLSDFANLTGLCVVDSAVKGENGNITLDNEIINFHKTYNLEFVLSDNTTEILAYDNYGKPAITAHKYGKGKVYFLNFPLESMLVNESNAFDSNKHLLYKFLLSAEALKNRKIISMNKFVSITEHHEGDTCYVVAINYSPDAQIPNFEIKGERKITSVIYGDVEKVSPYDATVFVIE